MKLHIGITAALLIIAAAAPAKEVSDLDRFNLWNECRPMVLVVKVVSNEADFLGPTRDAIEVAVRGKLRAAHLFTENDAAAEWSFLYINVNVIGPAYSAEISYEKLLEDPATKLKNTAKTWTTGGTGTRNKTPKYTLAYILAVVEHHTDEFIDEYLRVNAEACQ